MRPVEELSFTITGPPRTKKTHSQIVTRGRFQKIIPSAAYMDWNDQAQMQIAVMRAGLRFAVPLPIFTPVNIRALFFRHANVGDATGFYQALADTLQQARVIGNDSQIRSWNGSELLKDAAAPRVEVTIQLLEEPSK